MEFEEIEKIEPLDVLKMRLAQGEISLEEFNKIKQYLEWKSPVLKQRRVRGKLVVIVTKNKNTKFLNYFHIAQLVFPNKIFQALLNLST